MEAKLRAAAVRFFRRIYKLLDALRLLIVIAVNAVVRFFRWLGRLTERLFGRVQEKLLKIPLYRKYREYIDYMLFGFLTAAVQFAVYYLLVFLVGVHYAIADNIGFIFAVIVSYDTNKRFVYHNETKGAWNRIYQFIMFVGARLVGQLLETILLIVFVEWLGVPDSVAKFPVLAIVILINFLSGKLLVFTKQQAEAEKK